MKTLWAGVCLLCACEGGSTLAHPELFEPDDGGMDASSTQMLDARVGVTIDASSADTNIAKLPDARVEPDGALTPGWVVEVEGQACRAPTSMCVVEPAAVNAMGQSPLGPVLVTQLALVYYTGFDYGTELSLIGSAGGRPILLSARVDTGSRADHPNGPLCAPGRYESGLPSGTARALSSSLTYCDKTRALDGAVLTVARHDGPLNGPVSGSDTAVSFEGMLTVEGGGWSLQVPFSLSRPCATWILD